jgi:hypothetical protein
MNRRELATFVCGTLLGAALLVSAPTTAQDKPAKDGCGGCCEGAAPAGCDTTTPVKDQATGDGGMSKPETSPAAPGEKADCGGCDEGGSGCGDASMEQWMALGRPGESHKKLEVLAGTFATKATFWMEPGKAPVETTGLSVNAWTLGNRFIEQKFYGTCPMGMAFEGIGYTGFDNATGKFVGTWMDSMTTGIMNSVGECCSSGKTITFRSEQVGPGGMTIKVRDMIEFVSADSYKFTMWQAMGDAPEAKIMEIVYTRRS